MAVAEQSNSGPTSMAMMIDETYEFLAPQFFDFIKGESEDEVCAAELWFETALAYAPSPFMPRIKTGRSLTVESLCDFSQAEQIQETSDLSSDSKSTDNISEIKPQIEHVVPEMKEQVTPVEVTEENIRVDSTGKGKNERVSSQVASYSVVIIDTKEACTPIPTTTSKKGDSLTNNKKLQKAKQIASLVRNPSALKPPKSSLKSSQVKNIKSSSAKRETKVKDSAGTLNLAQENQAIKRQKLEEGKTRQILNPKPHNLPHKTKLGLVNGNHNVCSSTASKNTQKDRMIYVREPAAPFVSMAEMMRKFQSSTRDLSLPHVNSSDSHMNAKLTLTRPKEPEFETSQRVRSVKVKSSAELEKEMMSKIPKFKARPFNKKIFKTPTLPAIPRSTPQPPEFQKEMMSKIPKFKARPFNKKIFKTPTLPAIPRSTPQPPEFQEFHFETMERANHHAETASVASTESSHQEKERKPHYLTEPKTPVLQTLLRARPTKVKSSLEIEQEELEKVPKFKARPLNKKIFDSKGEMGIFCNTKKQITIPQEFHFATDERIPPPSAVFDLFDKLSLNSEPQHEKPIPKNTTPNPFHLHTEERGAEKERKFVMEVIQKQLDDERARIQKANPYPYTTDYPVVPPKPEPKQCTRPEPFQLESLVRHEEEMQREMEERRRKGEEEAQLRLFKAQPILKEDPIPLPEKVRKPLTQVQEFNMHVDHRAVDRAEFDHKIKEKEMMYKRYREESDAARMLEEEKALKQLRRTLVPHARPVPNFHNPFYPQKSEKDTTKAKSPTLRVLKRKEKRRMVKPAISSVLVCKMDRSEKDTTKAKSPTLRVLKRKEKRRMVKPAISSAATNMR